MNGFSRAIVASLILALWAPGAAGSVARGAATTRLAQPPPQPQAADAYGHLPLGFEPNSGRFGRGVRFVSTSPGVSVALGTRGLSFVLAGSGWQARASVVGMSWTGGAAVPPVAEMPLPGRVNWFFGSDRRHWRTNIPTYAQVRYRSVYPGIDLVLYGIKGRLEYDFRLRARADPSRIGWRFSGVRSIALDRRGELVLSTSAGRIVQLRPVAHQTVGGQRRLVTAGYLLRGGDVSLLLGAYDRSRPLVIDPVVLAYSTYLGGSTSFSTGQGIAVDALGNTYVTGVTFATDFPTTPGAFQTSDPAFAPPTAFVTKLNPAGTAPVYSTYLGSSNACCNGVEGNGIAVDALGDAYVTGKVEGPSTIPGPPLFPTTAGAFETAPASGGCGACAFVTKLDPTGSTLLYSTLLGGNFGNYTYGDAIAVDALGDAYVAGESSDPDLPATPGAFQTAPGGSGGSYFLSTFVAKLNPAGSGLLYSTFLGGSTAAGQTGGGAAFTGGIAIDAAGDAYVTGATSFTDFPTTPGAFQTTYTSFGKLDGFVTKLNPAGSALLYSTYLDASQNIFPGPTAFHKGVNGTPCTITNSGCDDGGGGIAVDAQGDAYVTGITAAPDFPTTPGAFEPVPPTPFSTGSFALELNPAGTAPIYSSYLLPPGAGLTAYAVVTDASGNAYVTGYLDGPGFCGSGSTIGSDAFLAVVNPGGSALRGFSFFGGTGGDSGQALALDGPGNAYITGLTTSADFPTTLGAFQTGAPGPPITYWAFASKLTGFSSLPNDCNAATDAPISATGTTVAATEAAPFSGTVASFSDPDTAAMAGEYTATIDWGDGSPTTTGTIAGAGGSFTVSGGHTYSEEGTKTVKVAITDADNATNQAVATSTATVADGSLSGSGASAPASGQTFSGPTATFSDADPGGTASDYTASIDWGDGSPVSMGTIGGPSGGVFTISGSHAYSTTGPVTIKTTIKDAGGSTATVTSVTLIAAPPTAGAFVIGDRNATTGSSVTFWGAQWWKANSLSGGPAPAAFKGFAARGPNPPSCGAGWQTDPGTNSSPPATIPPYIEVIVSSSIGKSGSAISGNTVHVVLVKTNSDYGPDPGHTGTGTVIRSVC